MIPFLSSATLAMLVSAVVSRGVGLSGWDGDQKGRKASLWDVLFLRVFLDLDTLGVSSL